MQVTTMSTTGSKVAMVTTGPEVERPTAVPARSSQRNSKEKYLRKSSKLRSYFSDSKESRQLNPRTICISTNLEIPDNFLNTQAKDLAQAFQHHSYLPNWWFDRDDSRCSFNKLVEEVKSAHLNIKIVLYINV